MLDNFKEIYDNELKYYDNELEHLILSHRNTRAFVYEICKRIVLDQNKKAGAEGGISAPAHRRSGRQ